MAFMKADPPLSLQTGGGPMSVERRVLAAVHLALWWVLVVGLVGLEIELLLLKHTEGVWQILPLVLLGVGLLIALWYFRRRSAGAVIAMSCAMALFIASGVAGTLLHYQGNVVYEQESNPGLAGRELYKAAVQGSTPTLAPGAMIQLGLLGFIVAFCGSRLSRASSGADHTQTKRAEP